MCFDISIVKGIVNGFHFGCSKQIPNWRKTIHQKDDSMIAVFEQIVFVPVIYFNEFFYLLTFEMRKIETTKREERVVKRLRKTNETGD